MPEVTEDQLNIINDTTRFKVIVAGRRWGKTHLALYDSLINNDYGLLTNPKLLHWYVAPTYKQAKNIVWRILKEIVFEYPEYIRQKNESELYIEFINGSRIELKGADKEDSLRGVGLDHVILDEFATMKKEAWLEVIRPALSDKKGTAMFIGTPDGFNYFYDVYQLGRDKKEAEYQSWFYKSIDSPYLDPAEIANARRDLDERTFRQEYEASFETAAGRVYYAFDRDENVKESKYRNDLPIVVCMDFNVSPMCWTIIQTVKDEDYAIDEITRYNTNTEEMSKALGDLYGYGSAFIIYGDYSGTFRSTSSRTTDYDIIKQILPASDIRIQPNPPVVNRVNAVNARLKNAAGQRRLFIDPKCKTLIKDFEQVIWKEGKREIDKANIELTHASDGVGYYIEYEYSLKGRPEVTHRMGYV